MIKEIFLRNSHKVELRGLCKNCFYGDNKNILSKLQGATLQTS